MMEFPQQLPFLLQAHYGQFYPVLGEPLDDHNSVPLDCSEDNPELQDIDLSSTPALDAWIRAQRGDRIGYGGYGERRAFYRSSPLFRKGDTDRCIHLGVDLWTEAHRTVYAPLGGTVHSLQNNDQYRDYGPTVILEHQLGGHSFYTLYGHLSTEDLGLLRPGQYLVRGERIGKLGTDDENGGWPPHLHFQIIAHLLGHSGDFPGVCTAQDTPLYILCCPSPMMILRKGASVAH
jgi:murein DD-endopeptidase MepM/ murein hydrolase activator NlpD